MEFEWSINGVLEETAGSGVAGILGIERVAEEGDLADLNQKVWVQKDEDVVEKVTGETLHSTGILKDSPTLKIQKNSILEADPNLERHESARHRKVTDPIEVTLRR